MADTITADEVVNLGTHTRIVALPNGARLEVLNGFGEWVEEITWTEN